MLRWLTILLLCQWLGELAVTVSGLAVPGPVVGMLLLLIGLLMLGQEPSELGAVADGLLQHLSLLFVPAGVGVMQHLGIIRLQWAPLLGVVILGTIITMLATGWVMQWLQTDSDEPAP